jgi:hypothetical protein
MNAEFCQLVAMNGTSTRDSPETLKIDCGVGGGGCVVSCENDLEINCMLSCYFLTFRKLYIQAISEHKLKNSVVL